MQEQCQDKMPAKQNLMHIFIASLQGDGDLVKVKYR